MLIFAGLMALVFVLALSEHIPRGLIIFIIVTLSTLGLSFIILAIIFRLPKRQQSDAEAVQPRSSTPPAAIELADRRVREQQNDARNSIVDRVKRANWILPNFSRLIKPRGVTNNRLASTNPTLVSSAESPQDGFHSTVLFRIASGAETPRSEFSRNSVQNGAKISSQQSQSSLTVSSAGATKGTEEEPRLRRMSGHEQIHDDFVRDGEVLK